MCRDHSKGTEGRPPFLQKVCDSGKINKSINRWHFWVGCLEKTLKLRAEGNVSMAKGTACEVKLVVRLCIWAGQSRDITFHTGSQACLETGMRSGACALQTGASGFTHSTAHMGLRALSRVLPKPN